MFDNPSDDKAQQFKLLLSDTMLGKIGWSKRQWRRQLWGTGARAPSTSYNFIYSSLWSKSDNQLSKYCVVCEISWCRCQQLTALSISTALVTKL